MVKKQEEEQSWDSGIVMLKPTIILQQGVQDVVVSTQRSMPNCEFSVLFKGNWHEAGVFYVTNEYIIPNQEVEQASVDYLENIAELRTQQGFNVVAHSHPFSYNTTFSKDDEETINSHFPCSLLSNTKGHIIEGNLLVTINEYEGGKLSIPVKPENIDINMPTIIVEGLEKIKKKPKPKIKTKHSKYSYV
jgi:hypothetical protein|tara:strand:+ start:5914 stop:6483 length:570 start_codon:yes stop_codon:yes gene_type:complete